MDADRIRELVSRREGEHLDFKREQYDWANEGAYELAKDLMAMGNALDPSSPPAYILVGIDEVEPEKTGRIVGIAPEPRLDDADLHGRVRPLLNRTPGFSYEVVEVDGLLVGVFEVKAGGRPFYAPRDRGNKHRLIRFEPRVRVGSSTDVASPDEVVEWAHRDDPDARELKRLQLQRERVAAQVRPLLLAAGASNSVDGGDGVEFRFTLKNQGQQPFTITNANYTARATDAFREYIRSERPAVQVPDDLGRLEERIGVPRKDLQPQHDHDFKVQIRGETFRQTIRKHGVPLANGFGPNWVEGEFVITVRDAAGTEEPASCPFSWPKK